jgi:murein DD-endopeptidase MepM/ murein hydrolase activator NlpD
MRKNNKLIITGIFILCLIIMAQQVQAADWWSNPITPWKVSQQFGFWVNPSGYHLGDDISASAYTKVENSRWGYVRAVKNFPALFDKKGIITKKNYGWVVIIESPREWETSTDPKDWKNPRCQVFGHLRNDEFLAATKAKSGKVVDRGWVVGRLGTTSENGRWAPHLHYGIREGRYSSSWVYWGYTTSATEKNKWNHPCDYIAKY